MIMQFLKGLDYEFASRNFPTLLLRFCLSLSLMLTAICMFSFLCLSQTLFRKLAYERETKTLPAYFFEMISHPRSAWSIHWVPRRLLLSFKKLSLWPTSFPSVEVTIFESKTH